MLNIANWSRRRQLSLVIALAILFLAIDMLTDRRIRFPITFLIPVALAAWYLDPRFAIGLGTVLTVLQFVLLYEPGKSDDSLFFGMINAIIRLAIFVGAAYTLGRLRQLQNQDVARISDLERILPICSHCKRVRDQGGRWESLEEFVAADLRCSHGLCEDCARRHYPDFFPASPD